MAMALAKQMLMHIGTEAKHKNTPAGEKKLQIVTKLHRGLSVMLRKIFFHQGGTILVTDDDKIRVRSKSMLILEMKISFQRGGGKGITIHLQSDTLTSAPISFALDEVRKKLGFVSPSVSCDLFSNRNLLLL